MPINSTIYIEGVFRVVQATPGTEIEALVPRAIVARRVRSTERLGVATQT